MKQFKFFKHIVVQFGVNDDGFISITTPYLSIERSEDNSWYFYIGLVFARILIMTDEVCW